MLAHTMSVLLVSQSCLMIAAHEARLVRRSVSATGDIIPDSAELWAGDAGNDNMDNELLHAYSLADVEGKSAQDVLSEVEGMFESEALNAEDGDRINIIKKLVNDELLPNLLKTRNSAQVQINKNLESIGSCNSKSEAKQDEV